MTRTKARRGKCGHEPRRVNQLVALGFGVNVTGPTFANLAGDRFVYAEISICYRCFDPLPLGPANDSGEHAERVAVERRAAEIALTVEGPHWPSVTAMGWGGAEHAGWIEADYDSQKVPEQDGEWSGWLAHYIYNTAEDRA